MKQKAPYYFDYFEGASRFPRRVLFDTKRRWIEENIRALPPQSHVLDAGCGAGTLSRALTDRYRVTGIDREQQALEHCAVAAADLARTRPMVMSVGARAELEAMPLPSGSVSAVIFCNVIEHLEDPRPTLAEIARVLAPGGFALITTENCASRLWVVAENTWYRLFGGNCRPYRYDVHPQRFVPSSFRTVVREFLDVARLDLGVHGMEMFLVGTKKASS